MYKNISLVYDKLMDVDYTAYENIISQELGEKNNLLILDLGCGSGALIKFLSNFGDVVGIDSSEEMLSIASSKHPAKYFALNLLDLDKLNIKFDFIVSAFDVLNYLDNFTQFKKGLANIYKSMNEGSSFIFDMHTPKKIEYMLSNQPFVYEDYELIYHWFVYETENEYEMESELSFFIKQNNGLYKKIEEYQKQRTYEIEKVFALLEEIGFKIKNYFCDFNKENKDYKNSQRIIFIVEK